MGAVSPLNNFRYDPNALTPGAFGAPVTPTFNPDMLGQSIGYPGGTQGQASGSPFAATLGPSIIAPPVTNVGFPTGNLAGPATDMFQMAGTSPASYRPPLPFETAPMPSLPAYPSANAPVSYPMSLGPTQFDMTQSDPSAMYGPVGMPGAPIGQTAPWATPAPSPYQPAGTRFSALA